MKQEKKIDIDAFYKELCYSCFETFTDNIDFWRGYTGGDEKTVCSEFSYINGVSDAVRYVNDIPACYSEEPGEDNTQDEEDD